MLQRVGQRTAAHAVACLLAREPSAGAVARRIVTYVEQGETVDIHDFIGFIKFGSRVDIFLPLDTEIKVKLGDRTWGGETLVAKLKNK